MTFEENINTCVFFTITRKLFIATHSSHETYFWKTDIFKVISCNNIMQWIYITNNKEFFKNFSIIFCIHKRNDNANLWINKIPSSWTFMKRGEANFSHGKIAWILPLNTPQINIFYTHTLMLLYANNVHVHIEICEHVHDAQ